MVQIKNINKSFIIFIILVIICVHLLFVINTEVERKTIDHINKEQMVHAVQAGSGIERFFNTYTNSLTFLSNNTHVTMMDTEGEELLKEYYLSHSNEISSITRVNEKGIILYTYPFESLIGTDISYQDHVQKGMSSHQRVVSDVFTSVQGFRTISLQVPVFSHETYTGSINILIPFDMIAGSNLEYIHVLDSGYSWAVSQNGTILYSPDHNLIDNSIYRIYESSPSVLSFVNSSMNRISGDGIYSVNISPSQSHVREYAIFKNVSIGDSFWIIIVATPENEILGTLQSFRTDLILISVVLLLSVILFTYYHAKTLGIIKEERKRRKTEEALWESEKNYRTIFENIQDAFYRSDAEGKFTIVSPSGAALLGYASNTEMIGLNIATHFYHDPADREMLQEIIRKKGAVTNYEVILKRKDNSLITTLVSTHAYYASDGTYLGIEGIFHDISDRKMAEQALQKAMKKLNILNSITFQDIQNHMFSLSGYLELLKSIRSDESISFYLEKVGILTQNIYLSLRFAKDYQDLGMKASIWQNVSQSYLYGISHLDISKIFRMEQIDAVEIYADPLLEKVFFILAENVLIHAESATKIIIRTEETTDDLKIIFQDNGSGIPDELKEQIFERGYGKTKGQGLFLAREILGITNISIREGGIFGEGACFEIGIPKGVYRFVSEQNKKDN